MNRRIVLAVFLLALGLVGAGSALFLQRSEPERDFEVELSEGDSAEIGGRAIVLEDFSVPKYPSGRARQFVSTVKIVEGGRETRHEISVNHPLRLGDEWIYQQAYDPLAEGTTVLRVVRDRWLRLAALSGGLLLAGALLGLFAGVRATGPCAGGIRRGWRISAGVFTVMLPLFVIGRVVFRPEPVPALQSPLMVPHVAAYATSYLILLFAAFGIGRRLMSLGFFLMTFALVVGAVWGKVCWGNWWQFDPKEMWSLATWLVYAAYLPLSRHPRIERWLRIGGAVMIVLTSTWVNFSRLFAGLHGYG